MNYQKVHDQIIQRAKVEIRKKYFGIYYENHHILPRSLGGNNKKENLVLLTAREHFLIHWLLIRIHPENGSLKSAFWMMCNTSNLQGKRYTPSSRAFKESKELISSVISKIQTGRLRTQEEKDNLSLKNKGQKRSKEFSENNSKKLKGRVFTEEHKKNLSLGISGCKKPPRTQEYKDAASIRTLGRKLPPRSESAKREQSETLRNKPKITCQKCLKDFKCK